MGCATLGTLYFLSNFALKLKLLFKIIYVNINSHWRNVA